MVKNGGIMGADITEKISIIVPVYNVQKYIERCLNSILAQTYSEFEVLCIDDGSTDESGKLCEVYRKRDDRVRVYHIENHGVSYARNYGLSLMEGKWFCFVDSDDWIEPNYLEKMYRLAIERQCHVVACGIDETSEFITGIKEGNEQIFIFDSSMMCIQNFICNKNSMHGLVWNKLYNRQRFGDVRFDEQLKVNEDCMYSYEIMSECDRACLTTMELYHWYIRPDSVCHKRAEKADFSAANVFLQLYDKLQGGDMDEARIVLRKNYIVSVVQVLLYAKYEQGDVEVTLAKQQCRKWKRLVWRQLDMKQKIKYWYAINFRSLYGYCLKG